MQQFAATLFAQVNRNATEAAAGVMMFNATDAADGVMMFIFLIAFAPIAVTLAGMWAVFAKAGKPGWAAIIPI